MKPKLLDLFSGAGGASKGYQRAGFEVWGVDHRPMPRYCGDHFTQADVFSLEPWFLSGFDAIHASPPCQAFSSITRINPNENSHADLIGPTRELLDAIGLPYMIENVEGAPLRAPVLICGSMFDPPLEARRHRLFESNWGLTHPTWPCRHKLWDFRFRGADYRGFKEKRLSRVVPVYGGTRYAGDHALRRRAMEIDWMSGKEITQAIPPAYTELIGWQLRQHLEAVAA